MKGTASGKFQKFKSLLGELSEFNVWNYTLSDKEVQDMYRCKLWKSGNVIRWEKNEIKVHRVLFKSLSNANDLWAK